MELLLIMYENYSQFLWPEWMGTLKRFGKENFFKNFILKIAWERHSFFSIFFYSYFGIWGRSAIFFFALISIQFLLSHLNVLSAFQYSTFTFALSRKKHKKKKIRGKALLFFFTFELLLDSRMIREIVSRVGFFFLAVICVCLLLGLLD